MLHDVHTHMNGIQVRINNSRSCIRVFQTNTVVNYYKINIIGGRGGSVGKTLDLVRWLILVMMRDCMGSNPATDLLMIKN